MSDTIAKLRELLLSQSKAGRLSGLIDTIYGAAKTGAEAYGSANSPMAPEHSMMLAGLLGDFTPVVGDIKSAYEGIQSARDGDWVGAGGGLLGALPFVPNIAGSITHRINPDEFLRLAAPFGHLGGRKLSRETVEFIKNKGNVSGAYLTVKESPNGLQVGLHDGRHRAVAAKELGVPFDVEIRKGERMKTKYPNMTQDELFTAIEKQGGLIPEI